MTSDAEIMEIADGERATSDADLGADARSRVAAIRELGELVRGRLELAADEVTDARFDAMWRHIDDAISVPADQRPVRESSRWLWRSIGRFVDRYRAHVLVGAVSAGAVGALALLLRPPRDAARGMSRGPVDTRAISHRPAEIHDLSTPGGAGTVFYLDDEDGTTTVIWVTPEDTVGGI